jgi:hypothetical protein
MTASCLSGFRFTLTQVFLQGHHESGALVKEDGHLCVYLCVCLKRVVGDNERGSNSSRIGKRLCVQATSLYGIEGNM